MDKDIIAEGRERFVACKEATNEQRQEMLEDLHFSNPADPQQWPDEIKRIRANAVGGPRPCLTFDQTNQFIFQVVNDSRQNKPSIKVRPVDSGADIKVAEALSAWFRHIEDVSRADIAYDTAIEYAARMGLGFLRVGTEVLNSSTNQQEIRIQRVANPLSVQLDPDWQEPDGSDAMFGFVESNPSRRAFARDYPDAKLAPWEGDTDEWATEKTIRVCEYFNITTKRTNMIVVADPINPGQEMELEESDYWDAAKSIGYKPPVIRTFEAKKRRCDWYKMTGVEILEQTEFPASYVPLVPVVGSELWIDGKRYLCGLVRPMKDPMRAYNYERTNYIEHVSLQTKIPYLVAAEAIEGMEDEWARSNQSNAAYLSWNHLDSNGQPLPPPQRAPAPSASQAYVLGAQQAQNDIQASVGMYRANLGAPSNETSGKAINARQRQGETANMHYADNMARSLRHVGKIVMEMLPRVYDTQREMRLLGDDGKSSTVTLDPTMNQAAQMKGAQLARFNPTIGTYDVSVQVGPAFGTRRQEAVEALKEIIGGNPQMMALLGDEFVRLMDIPDAQRISRRLQMMLPPQVQQAEKTEETGQQGPSPEVIQVRQQAQQVVAQLKQALDQQQQQLQQLQTKANSKDAEVLKSQIAMKQLEIAWYEAHTQRLALLQKGAQASAQLDADAAAALDASVRAEQDQQYAIINKGMDHAHDLRMASLNGSDPDAQAESSESMQ